jgi:hypothetical protein
MTPAPVPRARPSGPVRRTVTLTPPETENTSSEFRFRDATDRTETAPRAPLPLSQRQAAVEAYRQSLAQTRKEARR